MSPRWLSVLILLLVGGCVTRPDHVLFVTNTSLGIDFSSKPPTASIAYNRAEAYIGPAYANGALPPVTATFSTGGNIFSPEVRQLYATGAASLLATDADGSSAAPKDLIGAKTMTYFGTGTTVGLKVGFGESGTPDSMTFGYKRLEFSYVPLGSSDGEDAYPSLLASIDSTANSAALNQTGLRIQQFFATGGAADALAKTDEIKSMLKAAATGAVNVTLTDNQKAYNAGIKDAEINQARMTSIKSCVVSSGTFDPRKWGSLITKAQATAPRWHTPSNLDKLPDWAAIDARIGTDQASVSSLYSALPDPPSSC